MLLPRSRVGACSPSTHRIASTTFDLPHPLGPTTAVIPGAKPIVVESRKDLKPSSSRLLRRMLPSPPPHHHPCEAYPKVPSEGQEHPPTYRMSRDRYPSPLRRGRSVKAALRCRARAGVTEETLESHLQA